MTVEENKNASIFREKSLEAVESPEALNDYLRVTSPGVWLILAAIAALLIGTILWSVFGRIETTVQLAVLTEKGSSQCYVPYSELSAVAARGSVTVEGQDYALLLNEDSEVLIISEETSPYLMVAGKFSIGDVVARIPLEGELPNGVHTGQVVTESLKPMSLLLR